MPLAIKDGKLVVKDGKLCSSCCNQGSSGACCFLNDSGGYDCRLTSESRCDELGGDWYEDEECKSDDNPDGIDCSNLDPYGCCCYLDSEGNWQTEQLRKSDCDLMPQSSHSPDTDCDDVECPQTDPYGCCCYLDSEGNWQKEQLRKSDCDLMSESSHSPDTDCDDVECPPPTPTELGCCYIDIGDGTLKSEGRTTKADCQAAQGEVDPAIECTWIADTEETKDQPCPDQPVPVPGICLYRDDGLGSCWGYDFETYEYGSFGTEEEAQSWIDQGNCPGNPLPDAPSCASCSCEAAISSDDTWTVIQKCIRFEEEVDEFGNQTGSYICSKVIYLSSCTEDQCDAQGETNPLADIEWRNDKPANKCKVVASEDDCTESTGVFCPEVTECPEDLTAGCPETPNRSNPLP